MCTFADPLQISHACHLCWKCYKPLRFAHFWQRAQSLVPATQNDSWTSKSAPYPSVFCTFDFERCFAPQRRALFRHLNFQKCSDREVLLAFSLANVLRATMACTFSTSQLPQVVRTCSGATKHWKNTVFRDFPTFSRTCIFFLLALSLLWFSLFYSSLFYSSLLSDSSHLCFSSVHIVGSLTSKLPSVMMNLVAKVYWFAWKAKTK